MVPALPLHCGLGDSKNTFRIAYGVDGPSAEIRPSTHASISLSISLGDFRILDWVAMIESYHMPPRQTCG